MTHKKFLILFALIFLAAACNPFKTTLPAGVIKTVDGGVDWQFANTAASSTTESLASLDISKLAFDPLSSQIVFAGSYSGGLYESQDSAASWSNILSKIYVYDFAIDPYDSKTIYAAGFYDDHGRVLKTTDGGGSWNQIYNEESATNPVRAIALNPINPNELIIGMAGGTVNKSADGGLSWQSVTNFNDQVNRMFWQNNNIYVLLKTKGLYESASSTASFVNISAPVNNSKSFAGTTYASGSVNSFSQAYVDFTDPNLIYITTSGGLYKTVDGGTTWAMENLPVKPGESDMHAIAVSPSSSNLVYTAIGATLYKSLDGGNTWQTQAINTIGFINYILIDPSLPQITYAGIYSTQ